jgi:uncharacterized protein (DUF1330 family)
VSVTPTRTKEPAMPAYAIAHLRSVDVGPEIVEYLDRIDATLEPFGGHFVIHGATPEVREDEFPGTIVVIGFPDRAAATAWYDSPAYQAILPLRTEHSDGTAFIIDGVKPRHRAPDALRS